MYAGVVLLLASVAVTVTDAPLIDTTAKKCCPVVHEATNVAGDQIVRVSINGAANVGLHLFKVLFPVAPNDFKATKAGDVFICKGRGMKCRNMTGHRGKHRRSSSTGASPCFERRLIGQSYHDYSIINDLPTVECGARCWNILGLKGRAKAAMAIWE